MTTFNLTLILVLIFSFSFVESDIQAQKQDNIWLLGYSGEHNPRPATDSTIGGITMDFSETPVKAYYSKRKTSFFHTNASICNDQGELLFYTNGIYIGNKQGEFMDGGRDINTWSTGGAPIKQGAIILPSPKVGLYYMIYAEKYLYEQKRVLNFVLRNLRYAIVDMNQNNGLGKVIKKNIPISNNDPLTTDFFNFGFITACQHGNGRDWWIYLPHYKSPYIIRYLLDDQGLSGRDSIHIDQPIKSGAGDAKFTADGTKYVVVSGKYTTEGYHVDIFDFDRCSGELNNQRYFYDDPILDTTYFTSMEISPNSRFLYVGDTWHVFQYDLEADDIKGSRKLVATYDGFIEKNLTVFNRLQLGPDGKIYISAPGASHYLHTIHAPDSMGIDCRVEQHALKLPVWNNGTIPNFPHFRMGKLEGSFCDTLTNIMNPKREEHHKLFKVLPNPTSGEFLLERTGKGSKNLTIKILNMSGHIVYQVSLNKNINRQYFDLKEYPLGIYFVQMIGPDGKIIETIKVIIN